MKLLDIIIQTKHTRIIIENTIFEAVKYSHIWADLQIPMRNQITRLVHLPINENMWEYASYSLADNRPDLSVIFRRVTQPCR